MKRTKKLLTYLIALILVFATFNPVVKADPPGYDGIINYALSTDANETVVANYDKETKVLTISGNGHIDRALGVHLFRKCADLIANNYNGTATLRFEVAEGEDIFLPADSSEFFAYFFGNIEGLNDVNISEVTNMEGILSLEKNITEELNWDLINVEDISSMFKFSSYNHDLDLDITNVEKLNNFTYSSQIKNVTLHNASSLTDDRIHLNTLDSLTVYGYSAGKHFIRNSGSYLVQEFNGNEWIDVDLLDDNNTYYTAPANGDYRLITVPNKTNINDLDIDYNNNIDLGPLQGNINLLMDAIGLTISDSNHTLVQNTDFEIFGFGMSNTSQSIAFNGSMQYIFSVGGLGNYTGTTNILVNAYLPKVEGTPYFEEITEPGHNLSEVVLGIGSLEFNDDNDFEIVWLNQALNTGSIEVEQGKEYWYYAKGNPTINTNHPKLYATVIPWPEDEDPGPTPGNGVVGGDIIPVETEEVPDEEVPQASPTFEDVPADNMYFEAVEYLHEQGIIEGVTETMFMPNMTTSRAVTATVLYRMAGKPEIAGNQTLSDVMPEHWFYTPVTWGVEKGVIEGYDDGTYKPDVKLSKEQIVTMLHRYASTKEGMNMDADYDISGLEGYDMLEPYAMEAMKWAYKQGIVEGNKICPKKEVTRGELADMLMKFMKK